MEIFLFFYRHFLVCTLFVAVTLFIFLYGQVKYSYAQPDVETSLNNSEEVKVMMQADRLPPAEVSPVVIDDTRYEVVHWGKERGLEQNGGYIAAIDVASGQERWLLKIYDVQYDPMMEEDVQDIFIKSMSKSFFGKKLKIVDELGRKYTVDTTDRSIKPE
ncbi:MAG: hypothetical protein M8364_09725 [Methylobacter sp.]|uniref:hypothetical protein n=1 Tax=Methylobacter sp. TaxID=2051955 RepID=UPI00258DDE4D|nr:hypothetical protein [Methylobacter sp.]MCL7421168.1 hypothetical protein [Methylobacter sp.]